MLCLVLAFITLAVLTTHDINLRISAVILTGNSELHNLVDVSICDCLTCQFRDFRILLGTAKILK